MPPPLSLERRGVGVHCHLCQKKFNFLSKILSCTCSWCNQPSLLSILWKSDSVGNGAVITEMGNKFLKCQSVSIIQCDWSRFHCRFILENSEEDIVILDMSSTNKDSKFKILLWPPELETKKNLYFSFKSCFNLKSMVSFGICLEV